MRVKFFSAMMVASAHILGTEAISIKDAIDSDIIFPDELSEVCCETSRLNFLDQDKRDREYFSRLGKFSQAVLGTSKPVGHGTCCSYACSPHCDPCGCNKNVSRVTDINGKPSRPGKQPKNMVTPEEKAKQPAKQKPPKTKSSDGAKSSTSSGDKKQKPTMKPANPNRPVGPKNPLVPKKPKKEQPKPADSEKKDDAKKDDKKTDAKKDDGKKDDGVGSILKPEYLALPFLAKGGLAVAGY